MTSWRSWAVWDQIDEDFDGHLEEIRNFLRCPTVSASDDDMLAGAEYVAALIEGAGGTAEIVPTAGHPAVLGRIEGDGPRLLRYGMYDVQPADEPGWSSPPFAAVTADVPGAGPASWRGAPPTPRVRSPPSCWRWLRPAGSRTCPQR